MEVTIHSMAQSTKTQTNSFIFIIIIIALIIALYIHSAATAPAAAIPEIIPAVKTKTIVPKKTAAPVTIKASVSPAAAPAVKAAPTINASVVAPSTANTLVLTVPNGGDFWKRSVSKAITWQSTGLDKVWITLDIICTPGFTCAKSAPLNGHYTIAKDISASSGSYVWTAGTTIECGKGDTEACPFRNANYTMKICSADGVLCSQKDLTVTL
jgi:hypothetical protein